MNIKKGFTLAEVLVTLGVIGVITALSVPVVHQSSQKSQVGPVLRKFISTMETANEHLLLDSDEKLLMDAFPDVNDYINSLSRYIQGKELTKTIKINNYRGALKDTFTNASVYKMKDDREFHIGAFSVDAVSGSSYKGICALAYLDINGFSNKPDRLGKDIFIFAIDNNGSVLPYGGTATQSIYGITIPSVSGDYCTVVKPEDYSMYCSGMIADNDWKVTYKY